MKNVSYLKWLAAALFPGTIVFGSGGDGVEILPFGNAGQEKMLYDVRQRPQAVYLKDTLYLVYNGEGRSVLNKNSRRRIEALPMALSYDPESRSFSEPIALSEEYSTDHHDGPVIWADENERLHVFYGWHRDLGTHLVAERPRSIGASLEDWRAAPVPSQKMSYQWMSRVLGGKQLVFYRTDRHYSSWTYRITGDNGNSWQAPPEDVLDLDLHLGEDTDWSTYTSKAVSADGNFLHLGFVAYDDFKRPASEEEIASGELDARRRQNPRYGNRYPGSYKYNLYYVKIDLRSHEVVNHLGERIRTPIDRSTANTKCMIWDTQWRGGGIVPTMRVDDQGRVSFLHNLSDEDHEYKLSYYYVRKVGEKWIQTRIAPSSHYWNNGYIWEDSEGALRAYLLVGERFLEAKGVMDRYGGGTIEEWMSEDDGNTWEFERDLTPSRAEYPGWKYNNIQEVRRPDGSIVEG
ncbi:MAG: BNR-4 repeat-containing protein, partial [Verrucomicrobiota bacterium]